MPLPNGYTRLEYIQSTGSQYIDTGFKPNQDTRLVCEAKCPTNSGSNFLFGGRASISSNKFSFGSSTDKYYIGYGNSGSNVEASKISDYSGILFIDANKQNWTIAADAVTEEITGGTYSTFTSPVNLVLFACNTNGTFAYGSATLYTCQIYDNGTLVRDFVPCKNASGAIGLYDTVNEIFYTNKGSGTFTAGEELISSHNIVDGTLLDAAITATADAIRAKSGKTDSIAWNDARGFAGAVRAISGGKVASGSITPSSTSSTLTVSGIGFTPKRILLYLAPTGNYFTFQHKAVLFVEGGERKYCLVMGDGAASYIYNRSSNLTVTMNANGFTVNTNLTTAQFFTSHSYNYVAIG